jgi:hypothetical protein
MSNLVRSSGIFRYTTDQGGHKLVIALHHDFGAYYRALIPHWYPVQGTRFPAHVTVVRAERDKPTDLSAWGKYEGQKVTFEYEPYVHVGWIYYWLEVWCDRLEDMRVELGLGRVSEWTRPPGGRKRCFHTTIGNRKHVGPHPRPMWKCCPGRH